MPAPFDKLRVNHEVEIMAWYVYIAKSKTGYYYTGISPNPKARIMKHNMGLGSQMGKQQGPFELAHIYPPFPTKFQARKCEEQVKGWSRAKKDNLINGIWTLY